MSGAVFTLSAEAGLVCRMEVDKRKAKFTSESEEMMHNFRSLSLRKESGEQQEKYVHFYVSRVK